jgi:hypothetical protein
VAVTLAAATFARGHAWGDDFASYIMQAVALVEGRPSDFVRANTFTIDRSTVVLGPYAYPWGYPLLLAPLYAARGVDFGAFKSLNLVSLGLTMVLSYRFAVPRLGPGPALALAALVGLDAQVPHDAVVTFFKPRAMRLITGRQALATSNGDRLCATDYAVIVKQWYAQQPPLSDQWLPQVPCSLQPLFDNARFRVFAVGR